MQSAFAPVVWSTVKNVSDPTDGYWRSGGTGMISFFVSELDAMGGDLPMISRLSWGGEDHKLVKYLQKKSHVRVRRTCTPELWHLFHSKANWGLAIDGRKIRASAVAEEEAEQPWTADMPWKQPLPAFDGPQVLADRNLTNTYRCRQHLAGRLYPVRDKRSVRKEE